MTDEELERLAQCIEREDWADVRLPKDQVLGLIAELRAYRQATKDQPILRARVERMAKE